jgi:hypothetical protein
MGIEINHLIQGSPFLNESDKAFLIANLNRLSPLDKLKLKQNIMTGMIPPVMQQINILKQNLKERFVETENPQKQEDMLSKLAAKLSKEKPKPLLSASVLSNPAILGGAIPKPLPPQKVPPINHLHEISHPFQLSMLGNRHIDFGINEDGDQIVRIFLDKTGQIFDGIESVEVKRNFLMNYLQSELFKNYLNTGLTALRHPELEPHKIILNLLHQINRSYLNTTQFTHAAAITNNLRIFCAI